MKQSQQTQSALGLALFIAGLAILYYFAFGSVWADVEAIQFDAAIRPRQPFTGLQCPVLITKADEAAIVVSLENGKDTFDTRPIRVSITEGSVIYIHEFTEQIPVEVGEIKRVRYPITWQDAAWDRFVLAKVYTFSDFPFPAMVATCGVWVFHLDGITGNQLMALFLLSGSLGLAGGSSLWWRARKPLSSEDKAFARAMGALTLAVVVSVALGIIGNWLAGGLAVLVTILLSLTLLNRFWK